MSELDKLIKKLTKNNTLKICFVKLGERNE